MIVSSYFLAILFAVIAYNCIEVKYIYSRGLLRLYFIAHLSYGFIVWKREMNVSMIF